jgi:hypothetical protein
VRALRNLTASLVALTLLSGITAIATHRESGAGMQRVAEAVETTTTTRPAPATTVATTTVPPTTATTIATTTVPPTTAPATTAPQPVTAQQALPTGGAWTVDAYRGLGSWIDVYDWSETYGGGAVGLADIDRMASLGVQTLYIQPTRWDAETVLLEPDRLLSLINRARADGMRVVAWYLPDLGDDNTDWQRLTAIAQLPIDGLGIDIESRKVPDVAERNRRVVALSQALRAQFPNDVLSAIVLPPVVMEDVNPNYWPDYPWADIAPYYDVWMPMSYWTNRLASSGWRDAYTYTAVNIDRVRDHIGNPGAIVSTIGGIGDETSVDDVARMQWAAAERGVIGAGLYDYRTTADDLWPQLQQSRS